jgi:hypothetical protein
MNRALRRKADREIRQLMRDDHCSLCKRALEHNEQTFGGLTADDRAALVGTCCANQLTTLTGIGVYINSATVSHLVSAAKPAGRSSAGEALSPEKAVETVAKVRAAIAKLDDFTGRTARAAGLDPAKVVFAGAGDTPWKTDDAAWFEAHPTRAHRVRAPFPDETFPTLAPSQLPATAVVRVMVRQVEPGKRVRTRFVIDGTRSGSNFLDLMSDLFELADGSEEIAHALFDLNQQTKGGSIHSKDVVAMVRKYEARQGVM